MPYQSYFVAPSIGPYLDEVVGRREVPEGFTVPDAHQVIFDDLVECNRLRREVTSITRRVIALRVRIARARVKALALRKLAAKRDNDANTVLIGRDPFLGMRYRENVPYLRSFLGPELTPELVAKAAKLRAEALAAFVMAERYDKAIHAAEKRALTLITLAHRAEIQANRVILGPHYEAMKS